jgi:hypothetical protein
LSTLLPSLEEKQIFLGDSLLKQTEWAPWVEFEVRVTVNKTPPTQWLSINPHAGVLELLPAIPTSDCLNFPGKPVGLLTAHRIHVAAAFRFA